MKRVGTFITGLLVGATLFGGTAAYAAGVMAEQSMNRFLVDGQEVQLNAYAINGSNYLKLRDIGKAVGFNVYWDTELHCVQIVSDAPYTGVAPAANAEAIPSASCEQSELKPAPKVGDVILCSDGYAYEIKDVSKYNNSMFATEETETFPSPPATGACWISLRCQNRRHGTSLPGTKSICLSGISMKRSGCSTLSITPSETILRPGRTAGRSPWQMAIRWCASIFPYQMRSTT